MSKLKGVPPPVNSASVGTDTKVPKLCLRGVVGVVEERKLLSGREQHFYTGRRETPGSSSRGPQRISPPRRKKVEAFSYSARSQISKASNLLVNKKKPNTSRGFTAGAYSSGRSWPPLTLDNAGRKVHVSALETHQIPYKVSSCKTPRGQNALELFRAGLETGKFKKLKYPHLTKCLGLSYGTHLDHGQVILKVGEDPFQFGEKAQEFEDLLHEIYETYRRADTVDPEKLPEMIMKLFPGDLRPSVLADFKRELLEVLEADISTLSDEDVFVELTNYILEHQPRGAAKPYMVENSITAKDVIAGQLSLRSLFNQYSTDEHRIMRTDIGEVLQRLGIVDSLEDLYDSRIEDWLLKRTNAREFDEEPDYREIFELSESLDFHELTDLVNYFFHYPDVNEAIVGSESQDNHKIAPTE